MLWGLYDDVISMFQSSLYTAHIFTRYIDSRDIDTIARVCIGGMTKPTVRSKEKF